jgi:hypothetical protein
MPRLPLLTGLHNDALAGKLTQRHLILDGMCGNHLNFLT